ncbi:hypothetical protein F53441_10395 [Fusarium austroafricanum]|uniref:Uncharacterized protein n=1 Tax=Fusarium austroafricanum TaxID=2364996 RepID=A0A8H4K9S4_9HYPO|nr:hypothetical protein F53441_10395 [Fusarium austroafricanum]
MPPRRGGKGKSGPRAKPKRQPTRIGQLDTTPTSRHSQSPRAVEPQDSAPALPNQDATFEPPHSQIPSTYEFDDGVDDVDLIRLAADEAVSSAQQPQPQDFPWSEVESTRRSTPLRDDEPNLFNSLDSAIDEFSSPKSGRGKLPTTQPLSSEPVPEHPDGAKVVDFSETASTARRSSPYYSLAASQVATEETLGTTLNNLSALFPSTILDSLQVPGLSPYPPVEAMDHLPEDELYDVTPPPKSSVEPQVAASSKAEEAPQAASKRPQRAEKATSIQSSRPKRKSGNAKISALKVLAEELATSGDEGGDEQASSSLPEKPPTKRRRQKKDSQKVHETPNGKLVVTAAEEPETSEQRGKGKKGRKQRAKTPFEFDDETQTVKEPPPKVAEEQVHMPIVKSMIKTYAASASPVTSAERATPNTRRKAIQYSAQKPTLKPTKKDGGKSIEQGPQKVLQASRKSGLRSTLPQDKPKPAERENKHVSSVVLGTKGATENSPVTNTRTTRAKAKEEMVSTLGPPASQKNTETVQGTQGSTQDPILLSSGSDSSGFSDDEGFVPTEETRPTENTATVAPTQGRSLVEPIIDTTESSNKPHCEETQPVAPLRPQLQNHKPVRPSHPSKEQGTGRKKAITVRPDPKTLVEEPPQSARRNRPGRSGPKEVLSARDANIHAQRHTPQAKSLKRPSMMIDPTIDNSQPARKASKVSRTRSFNVSQVGSPLPLETVPGRLIDVNNLGDTEEVEPATSLRGRDEVTTEDEEGKEYNQVRGNKEATEQTRPEGPNEEMAERLHGIVETMIGHLRNKEAIIYRGADAYRKNSINCVDKIERRYEQEKQALHETWKKDGDRFVRGTRVAKSTLEERGKTREKAKQQVEETAARRRYLFQQATTSLRALHGRLMKRKLADYED